MLWLCLRFAQLPLEVFTRGQDADRAELHPCIVVQDHRVALCNDAAEDEGLKPGMSVATAYALSDRVRTLKRHTDKENCALEQLAQWAYRFTPMVVIKQPDCLLLEVGATLRLFNGLATIVRQINEDMASQGYSYHSGLAHTPKAAWLLARSMPDQQALWFCTRKQQLKRDQLDQVLAQTPLQLLDYPVKTLDKIARLGLSTLGEIRTLPRPALGKRFGKGFLHYLDQLSGDAADIQTAVKPDDRFERELHLLDPIHTSQTLLFPMQRMLKEFAHFLRARQLDCPGFHWDLLQLGEQDTTLTIQLSRPQHSAGLFTSLTKTRLENFKLKAPVDTLRLRCKAFSSTDSPSGLLFEELKPEGEGVSQLLDKLRARLDKKQVYSLACRDQHVPERAWARVLPERKAATRLAASTEQRPCWLLRRPSPIKQSANQQLYWHGKLDLLQGPERIQSLWSEPQVNRDYFIARHEQGSLYWIFHDSLRGSWYLHGVFS